VKRVVWWASEGMAGEGRVEWERSEKRYCSCYNCQEA